MMAETQEMPARFVPDPGPARLLYVQYDNGALSVIETDTAGDPELPAGAHFITLAEYGSRLNKLTSTRDGDRARALAAERDQQRADYDALAALGVPEALARRLTGHDAS